MKTLDYALWGLAGLVTGATLLRIVSPAPVEIVDMRSEYRANDRAAPHIRSRDPSDVYAVVLHQMAFSRGNDPRSYLRTTAHYIITPAGGVYWLNDHSVNLPAADGFNSGSISVEFVGNFPNESRSTDPRDWWYPKKVKEKGGRAMLKYQNQLTPEQAISGRALLTKLQKEDGINMVLAHRQSEDGKGNDPGPDVWGAVGEFGVRDLGMSDGGTGYFIPGEGLEIPTHWRQAYNIWNGRSVGPGSAVA